MGIHTRYHGKISKNWVRPFQKWNAHLRGHYYTGSFYFPKVILAYFSQFRTEQMGF